MASLFETQRPMPTSMQQQHGNLLVQFRFQASPSMDQSKKEIETSQNATMHFFKFCAYELGKTLGSNVNKQVCFQLIGNLLGCAAHLCYLISPAIGIDNITELVHKHCRGAHNGSFLKTRYCFISGKNSN